MVGVQSYENITNNSLAGTVTIASGFASGSLLVGPITPISFSSRGEVVLQANAQQLADIQLSVLNCSGSVITGFSSLPLASNSRLDISSLSSSSYACLLVRLELEKNGTIAPVVSNVAVSWSPLPVLLTTMNTTGTIVPDRDFWISLGYSLSYTDDTHIVAYLPLASQLANTISGYTSGYSQSLDMIYVSATQSGLYTTGGTIIGGTIIPANSVYRNLGSLNSPYNGLLQVKVKIPPGVQSGTRYLLQGFVDGDLSSGATTNLKTIRTISSPNASVLITSNAADFDPSTLYDYKTFVRSGTSSTSFLVTVSNQGNETLFAPVASVNISSFVSAFSGGICSSSLLNPINWLTIGSGGVLSGTTIMRDLDPLTPGATSITTFSVDFALCTAGTIGMTGTLTADNTAQKTYFQDIDLLTDLGVFSGNIFSKSFQGTHYNGDVRSFQLSARNAGFSALGDVLLFDKIDPNLQILGVSSSTNTNSIVFYHTGFTGNAVTSPPAFNYSSALSGVFGTGWTTTNPGAVSWIAIYSKCISSSIFPTALTGDSCYDIASSQTFTVQVKSVLTNACQTQNISNSLHGRIYSASTDIANTNAFMSGLSSIVSTVSSTASVSVAPKKGSFYSAIISGTSIASVGNTASYTLTLNNNGFETISNAVATISLPQIAIDGVLQYLSLNTVSATQGMIDYSALPNTLTVNVGDIQVGSTKTISLSFIIPSGVSQNDSYTLAVQLSGSDSACGTVSASQIKTTSVNGNISLLSQHYRDLQFIFSGGNIIYNAMLFNVGEIAVPDGYVIIPVPSTLSFVEAYLSGTDVNQTVYNCDYCDVFFADSNPLIPSSLTTSTPFVLDDILTQFSAGSSSVSGVRTSPFGTGTKFMAVHVKDVNDVRGVGANIRVGFKAQDVNSQMGIPITNYNAVLSSLLPQTISAPVFSFILEYPGLSLNVLPVPQYLPAGAQFVYTLTYYNDSQTDDETVSLQLDLPDYLSIVGVSHQRNALTVSGGATGALVDVLSGAATVISGNLLYFHAHTFKGSDIHSMEGGALAITVQVDSGVVADTIFDLPVVGSYSNGLVSSFVSATDFVQIKNPDLYIRKNADNMAPIQDESVSYFVLLSNEGAYLASGVVLTDSLPVGLCYQTGSTVITTSTRSLTQPLVSGNCVTTPQTLIRTGFKKTSYATGVIPASSEDISFHYSVNVASFLTGGTSLSNTILATTSLLQSPNVYSDTGTSTVRIPYPDLQVLLTHPYLVQPGDPFTFSFSYRDINKAVANQAAVVLKLPDYNSDGSPDITIDTVTPSHGQIVYYHTGSLTGTTPILNPLAPSTSGWTTVLPTAPSFVGVTSLAISGFSPSYQINILALARDPFTNAKIPAGVTLPLSVSGTIVGIEDDYTNNFASGIIVLPGIDLSIDIQGSPEGVLPGMLVGDPIVYTVTYKNNGTQDICNVYLDIDVAAGLVQNTITHDFSNTNTLSLPIVDASGNPVYSIVPIGFTRSGTNLHFLIGDAQSANRCLVPGAEGTFTLHATTDGGLNDSTVLTTYAHINQSNDEVNEDILSNNDDSTSVIAYKSDLLMLSKHGIGHGLDGILGNSDDTLTMVNSGDTITYKIDYNNIGNFDAQNVVITDILPAHNCFQLGSMSASPAFPISRTFSIDKGNTRNYSPVLLSGSVDCSINGIKATFQSNLPAPANVIGEGSSSFAGNLHNVVSDNGLALYKQRDGAVSDVIGYGPNQTYSIAVGDMNNDGNLDVIVGNSDTYGQVNQYVQGNGDGTFDAAVELTGGSRRTSAIVVGDLNNDGNLDIVVGNYLGASQYLLGNGDGTFDTAIDLAGEDSVYRILALGDMNNDSGLDLIYVGSGGLTSLTNNNNGTFGTATIIPTALCPSGLGIGDINEDGNLDVVFLNPCRSSYYAPGSGDGTFGSNVIIPIMGGAEGRTLALGDMNEDTHLDLIIGHYWGGGVLEYIPGSGNGSFGATVPLSTGSMGTLSLAIGDMNHDNHLDVIVGNNGSPANKYIPGNGNGTFGTAVNISGMDTQAVALGDMNNDGNLDIIVGNSNQSANDQTNQYVQGNGDGTFQAATSLPGFNRDTFAVALGDMNNDNHLDLILGQSAYQNQYMQGSGDGTFGQAFDLPGGQWATYHLGLGDMNEDGNMDVIAGNNNHVNQFIPGNGNGTFGTAVNLSGMGAIALGDMNNDNHLDMVVGIYGQVSLYIPGNGDGTFGTAVNLPGGVKNTYHLALGDMNEDGNMDVILGNQLQQNEYIPGSGDGTFGTAVNLPGLSYANHIVVGDINEDGHLDMVIGNDGSTPNTYIPGNGDGTFGTGVSLSGGNDTEVISLLDMNEDGHLDIIIGNYGPINKYLLGNGDGTFGSPIELTGGARVTRSIAVGDINEDGDVDIALGTHGGGANQIILSHVSYINSGTYTYVLPPAQGLLARDRLFINNDVPVGTSLSATLYSASGTTCLSGTALLGPLDVTGTAVDISSLSSLYDHLCLIVDFATTDDSVTPAMYSYGLSYVSTTVPYLSYRTIVHSRGLFDPVLMNIATIMTDTPEISMDNNTASYTMVVQEADLSVTKQQDKAVVFSGDQITYTLTYKNSGPYPSLNTVLRDYLPNDFVYLTSSLAPSSNSGGVLQRDIGTMGINQEDIITVVGNITGTVQLNSLITNTTTLSSSTRERNLTNNNASVTSVAQTLANLYTTISCAPVAYLGGALSCSVSYGNNGNVTGANTTLTVVITSGATLTSLSGNGCGIVSSGTLSCTFGNLAPNTTGSFSFLLDITDSFSGFVAPGFFVRATSTIATSTTESTLTDNVAIDQFIVTTQDNSVIQGFVYRERNNNTGYNTGIDSLLSGVSLFRGGVDVYGNVYLPASGTSGYAPLNQRLSGYAAGVTGVLTTLPTTSSSLGEYFIAGIVPGTYYLYVQAPSNRDVSYSRGGTGFGGPAYGSVLSGGIQSFEIINIPLLDSDYHSLNIFALLSCGDTVLQSGEQCDGEVGCSNLCTRETPSCSLNFTTNDYVASGSITGTSWGVYDFIDFGDATQITGITANTIYTHTYENNGTGTITVQVHNPSVSGYTQTCTTGVLIDGPYCGDSVVDSGEQCDGQVGCSNLCTRETPSCSLSFTTNNYVVSGYVTGTSRGVYGPIDFGDALQITGIVATTIYTHTYGTGGTGTISVQISNPSVSGYSQTCTTMLRVTGNVVLVPYTPPCLNCGGFTTLRPIAPPAPPPAPLNTGGKACMYSDEKYRTRGPFSDVSLNQRSYPYIETMRISCLHRGVGTTKGLRSYAPNANVTKAEVLKTMVKILGITYGDFGLKTEDEPYTGSIPFADMLPSYWFVHYASYAYDKGLTAGLTLIKNGKSYLTANEYMTRGQTIRLIIMVYEMINHDPILFSGESSMLDVTPNDPYYFYIRKAEALGFVSGSPQANGSFKFEGNSPITRAAFAKMVTVPFSEQLFSVDDVVKNSDLYQSSLQAVKRTTSNKSVFISQLLVGLNTIDIKRFILLYNIDKKIFLKKLGEMLRSEVYK